MDPHAPAGAIRAGASALAAVAELASRDRVVPRCDPMTVDEVLRLWLGCHLPPGAHADGRAVAVRVPGREWTVAPHPGIVDFPTKADVVTGPASAFDLWLCGRTGEEDLSIEGDLGAARALRAAVAAVTR